MIKEIIKYVVGDKEFNTPEEAEKYEKNVMFEDRISKLLTKYEKMSIGGIPSFSDFIKKYKTELYQILDFHLSADERLL